MKLSATDADLFYKLMWSLQFYVNQRLQMAPYLNSIQLYSDAPLEEKAPIRTAVYENLPLIDDFIRENPAQLARSDLDIIYSWRQHCLAGDFYIERFLKNGAILLGDDPHQVFQVSGIYDSLAEMFVGAPLPLRIQTVLLPFKDKIVYDGLLSIYHVYFGSGITASLHEGYMAAKQNGRIITSFNQKPTAPKIDLPNQQWQSISQALSKTSKKLKGKRQAPIQSQSFAIARASAELVETAVSTPDDIEALFKLHRKLQRALNKLENTLYRAD